MEVFLMLEKYGLKLNERKINKENIISSKEALKDTTPFNFDDKEKKIEVSFKK